MEALGEHELKANLRKSIMQINVEAQINWNVEKT